MYVSADQADSMHIQSCAHHVCCPASFRRVYSYQLRPIAYSTAYSSLNALPHKVTAVANSTCPAGNKGSKGCQPSHYLRDEQGNNVTFAMVDAIVYGGGAIHAINSVLQANDYYPSVTAALTRNPTAFSELTNLVLSLDQLLAPFNISILNTLETTPGSIAAPVNSVCGVACCCCAHFVLRSAVVAALLLTPLRLLAVLLFSRSLKFGLRCLCHRHSLA